MVLGNKMIKIAMTTSLMLAMFFNPLGFDAIFAFVMKLTSSYWTTDLIFYLTSAFWFMLYFILSHFYKKSQTNPIYNKANKD